MALFLQHTGAALLFSLAAFGQPAFEAASVKPAVIPAGAAARSRMTGGPDTNEPGQITYSNVTLASVLLRAYDVKAYQVAGPDWLSSQRYDIAAKIPPGATRKQFQLMLQRLLAERFHLALHHETRELHGFDLIVGKNGPKLKPAQDAVQGPTQPAPDTPPKTDAGGFPILDHPGMALMEGVKGKAVISFVTAKAQTISAL